MESFIEEKKWVRLPGCFTPMLTKKTSWKKPDKRIQTIEELRDNLQKIL